MASVLVVGFGSIGSRHARVARDLGHEVAVVSRRGVAGDLPCYPTIDQALLARGFDGAVVATETASHALDLKCLLEGGFGGRILVEKPLFATSAEADVPLIKAAAARISVAYNLRFHPALIQARRALDGARILNIVVHVGQDLRQWRTDRPVENTYSSQRSAGGGALRDLSHELDYLLWLFGPWREVTALGGRIGDLPGDSDDCWSVAIRFTSGAIASLAIDYFCRRPVRTLTCNSTVDTVQIDLVKGVLVQGAGETTWPVARDLTYREQMDGFLNGRHRDLCTFGEAMEVMRLIEAIERVSDREAMAIS